MEDRGLWGWGSGGGTRAESGSREKKTWKTDLFGL